MTSDDLLLSKNCVKHPRHDNEIEDVEKHCVCFEVRSGTFVLFKIAGRCLFICTSPLPLFDKHCLRYPNSYTNTFAEIMF